MLDMPGVIRIGLVLPLQASTQKPSENFLDFYSGALLALREMGAAGLKADLQVYDSADSKTAIPKSLIDESDVIIGPVSYEELEFLGSSCIYPRMAPQPMPEGCLLTSELEKTNEAYALAKISGLKYCEYLNRQYGTDFISVMPTNLYGPNDNYHPEHSHVLPALIRRFHEAKTAGAESVTCWGDGSPLREFLYVDDLANLCVFLMNNYSGVETVNAGTGKELSIKDLTELVARVVGYTGRIEWDTTRPNGTPRKLLDVSKATRLGWTYRTELEEGIRLSYEDFLTNPMRAER